MSDQATKVLLLGATPAQMRRIRETLATVPNRTFEMSHLSRVSDAISHLERGEFDVVLLNTPTPGTGATDATDDLAKVVKAAAGAGVVLLVQPSDVELGRHALGAGARAYLVKDQCWELDAGLLLRTIAAAGSEPVPTRAVRRDCVPTTSIFGFVGARGGTGATSIALRVARILARRGISTTLAELGNSRGRLFAALGLGTERQLGPLTMLDADQLDSTALDRVFCSVEPNLKVLLAPPADATQRELSPEHARRLLDSLESMVDCIVVDLPAQWTPSLETVCRRSTMVCLVTESDPACLWHARVVTDLVKTLSDGRTRIGAVLVDRTPSLEGELVARRELSCCDILVTVPVPSGCRLTVEKGEDESRLPGVDVLNLRLEELADRLYPCRKRVEQDRFPLATQ